MKNQNRKILGKRHQSSVGMWHRKFKEQIRLINSKKHRDSSQSVIALEIMLAYFYLYMFVEAATDYFFENIFTYSGRTEIAKKYRQERRYLIGKIEFIFENIASNLHFSEFTRLKDRLRNITRIRNQIVHFEEISWQLSGTWGDKLDFVEIPTSFTQHLTRKTVKKHYNEMVDYFEDLKSVLKQALKEEKYGGYTKVDGKIVWRDPDAKQDLIDHMAELCIPKLSKIKSRIEK